MNIVSPPVSYGLFLYFGKEGVFPVLFAQRKRFLLSEKPAVQLLAQYQFAPDPRRHADAPEFLVSRGEPADLPRDRIAPLLGQLRQRASAALGVDTRDRCASHTFPRVSAKKAQRRFLYLCAFSTVNILLDFGFQRTGA
jgi:hypothetical protein